MNATDAVDEMIADKERLEKRLNDFGIGEDDDSPFGELRRKNKEKMAEVIKAFDNNSDKLNGLLKDIVDRLIALESKVHGTDNLKGNGNDNQDGA